MPVLLDDISTITNKIVRPNTPRFFSSLLTGSGGRGGNAGLLNAMRRPGRYTMGQTRSTMPITAVDTKSKTSSNGVVTRTMPFDALTISSHRRQISRSMLRDVPDSVERFEVTANAQALDFDVFCDLTPQGATLVEDGSGDKTVRHLDVLYRMEVFVIAKTSAATEVPALIYPPQAKVASTTPAGVVSKVPGRDFVLVDWSYAPLDDIEALIENATAHYTSTGKSVFVDTGDLAEWMNDYDLYDRICRQADMWTGSGIGEVVAAHITTMFSDPSNMPSNQELNDLAVQLRYLENYDVPLDAYRTIYAALHASAPADISETLTKQNLNLLMNGTLAQLDDLKPQLAVPAATPAAMAALPTKFSAQQRAAITTAEPLSLTTAGAGTGKSTTILARIDYLVACGVDPRNITVLSFTNAAADNILAKNPAVGSMTIARMVLEIYKLNFPSHQISTIDSINNALDIFFPHDDMAHELRRRLRMVSDNKEGATTELNAFVEMHYDKIIPILDRIQQTCLELQIIVAYHQIDNMIEPPHLAGQFLIVDEVQDNSIFEFIYLLRYVAKHRQNMFIVGDASQTLYEFRSANPKALNALEGSGVFACHKLTTNYRSNQEILDFANVHLADIEANSLSQIRLQANSLVQPTAQSFKEAVTLDYHTYASQKQFTADLPALMMNKVGPYVEACLARGEKVAFMAFRSSDVTLMEKTLEGMFPAESVANITSKRRRPMTVFSSFVKNFWDTVVQVHPKDGAFAVSEGIRGNLDQLMGRSAATMAPIVDSTVSDWWIAQAATVNGWVAMFNAGQMTKDAFFDLLMRNLLDYEIDQNGLKQNILNQQNRMRKEQNATDNARLIVSTIHGAKGLEFDNVVVLHQYDSQLPEDRKRMYYVALTRAMKSEYVLSFGKVKSPRIETDYELIVDALMRREATDALRAGGIDIDAISEEELAEAIADFHAKAAANEAAAPVGVS